MRIEFLLLCLIACLPSNSVPVITLPDRTSIGRAPDHYDPCVKSYTQKTKYLGIEEHICVSSIGNTNVEEYFDVMTNYPCTWQPTKDGKTRCIPAIVSDEYYADIEYRNDFMGETDRCLSPIAQLKLDTSHHSASFYVGIADHKGKFSVYEVGPIVHLENSFRYAGPAIYSWHWDANWEEWNCYSLLPVDLFYPGPKKGFDWFAVGPEADLTLFQER